MNTNSISANDSPVKRLPSYQDIITAPAGQWRELVRLVDGDEDFYERVRAHHQAREQGEEQPKKKQRPRNKRTRRSTKKQTAGQVFQSQIGDAMAEAVKRVNEQEDPPDQPEAATRLIPVNHWLHGTYLLEVPA